MPDSWERLYGLDPNDPSDANLDLDGDGISNLAEFRAGTNPNDPNSYLRIDTVVTGVSGRNWGVQITWGSVSNRLYTIQRSGDLRTFSPLVEHVLAAPPVNVFFDSSITNEAGLFYRLKLE